MYIINKMFNFYVIFTLFFTFVCLINKPQSEIIRFTVTGVTITSKKNWQTRCASQCSMSYLVASFDTIAAGEVESLLTESSLSVSCGSSDEDSGNSEKSIDWNGKVCKTKIEL